MEHRTLDVDLTEDEVAERANVLASLFGRREQVEQERKAAADAFKSQLREIDGSQMALAKAIRTRKEPRITACVWERDDGMMLMRCVRQDTGEVVETRAMSDEERQGQLFTAPTAADSD